MFKKKVGKVTIFDKNLALASLEKAKLFAFLHLFCSLKKCFFVVECRKTPFPWLILPKKKVRKMSIVGPKRWDVNSLGKISILQVFEVLVFIA